MDPSRPIPSRREALGALVALPLTARSVAASQAARAPTRRARVVRSMPHDTSAFTQGLIVHDGVFYESTGRYGQSTLRRVNIDTGEVLASRALPSGLFAEGLAEWQGKLYQLTWRERTVVVSDLKTLAVASTLRYDGEAWGLTHDRTRFVLSDGSDTLRFLASDTFREIGRVAVRDSGRPVQQLNELEFVRGEIWANIWHEERVARIDPATGHVRSWIDLSGLLPATLQLDGEAVLNGIAHDAARNRLFVTGKLWPRVFEIAVA